MLTKSVQSLMLRSVRSRGYQTGGHHRTSTMNDLPIPQGDWHEAQHRKNSKYNAILIAGILSVTTVIGLIKSNNLINFNASPPESIE